MFWKICVMVLLLSSCKAVPKQASESDLESLRGKYYHLVLHPTPTDSSRFGFYVCHRFDGSLEVLKDKGLFSLPSRCVSAFQDAGGDPVSYSSELIVQEQALSFESLKAFVEESENKTAEQKQQIQEDQVDQVEVNVKDMVGTMIVLSVAAVIYGLAAAKGKVPSTGVTGLDTVIMLTSVATGGLMGSVLVGGVRQDWQMRRLQALKDKMKRCQAELARIDAELGEKETVACKVVGLRLPSFDRKMEVNAADYLGVFGEQSYDTKSEVPHVISGLGRFFKRVEFGHGDSKSMIIDKVCLPSVEVHYNKPRSICIDVERDWDLYNWRGQRRNL